MTDAPATWNWDGTLFSGAAPYYDRGRPPYAPTLATALRDALGLDGSGRLLDVGCGPGSVTLPFAPLFAEAIGVDQDAGMLAEAGRLAAERGITNARWVRMLAEDLPGDLGHFRVITFAASFHWMDRDAVARTALAMLDPGGAVVHVDNHHQDGFALTAPSELPEPPDAAIAELRQHYLGPERRAGQRVCNGSPGNEAAVFRSAGFEGPESVAVPDGRVLERSIDDVVAHVFSNSATAPHLFGPRLAEFEADLRSLLIRESPRGTFAVQLPDNELKIWHPAAARPQAHG
jgi:trans-aconitate methyltransferase